MTNIMSVPRRAYLTTALAVGVALTFANVANAKGSHHHDGNNQGNGASPHFIISGQNAKKASSDRKNKKDKYADKKKKDCGRIICQVQAPGGNTRTSTPPSQTAGGTGTKGPSPGATIVTISNGVTKSAIENGKGITVTSNSPGTITVSNGSGSVTMPGGSVTLSGALSVSVPAGYQLVRLSNGDFSVAVSPVLAGGPPRRDPPGVTATDILKDFGKVPANTGNSVAAGTVVVPTSWALIAGTTVFGTIAGDPVGSAKQAANDAVNDAVKVIEWVGSWF
jgi:hypothetical protein